MSSSNTVNYGTHTTKPAAAIDSHHSHRSDLATAGAGYTHNPKHTNKAGGGNTFQNHTNVQYNDYGDCDCSDYGDCYNQSNCIDKADVTGDANLTNDTNRRQVSWCTDNRNLSYAQRPATYAAIGHYPDNVAWGRT